MIQSRDEDGVTIEHPTLDEAFSYAESVKGVWKISFSVGDERVRLVRSPSGWVYEDIHGRRRDDYAC